MADEKENLIDVNVDFKFEGLEEKYKEGVEVQLRAYADYDESLVENPIVDVKWYEPSGELFSTGENFVINDFKRENSGKYTVDIELTGDNITKHTKTVEFEIKVSLISENSMDYCLDVIMTPENPVYGDKVKLKFYDTGFANENFDQYDYTKNTYFKTGSEKYEKFINESESKLTDKGYVLVLDNVPMTEDYIGKIGLMFDYDCNVDSAVITGDKEFDFEPFKTTINITVDIDGLESEYKVGDDVKIECTSSVKDDNIIDLKMTTRWYKGKTKITEGKTLNLEATKENSGKYECRVLVEGKYNFPSEKSKTFNIVVKDVKPPEPEPSPEIDDEEFKFIEMPHRESVFAYLPFWAMAEISHAKENGVDWETDFAELKFAGIAGTLAELYKKYKIVELQESRNGKLVTTKEELEKGYYNINF